MASSQSPKANELARPGFTRQTLESVDRLHVWHPFTQMAEYVAHDGVIVERAEGNELIDVDGRRYLDGVSSLWCNLFGHRVERIDRAIRHQLEKVAHSTLLGIANVPSIELARKLVDITPPSLTRVFFSDNGSTSVEVALKMAYQYWQQAEGRRHAGRRSFLTIESAYHGDTVGSVSLGGIRLFHSVYEPLLFRTYQAPSPYCYRCPLGLKRSSCGLACADRMDALLRRHHRRIAAVVMEPLVQGAAGMIVHPPGYLRRVRAACTRHGVFLILDEVATGFGRTGRMFAFEHEDVAPDFLCLSKGLTGGYLPMAATLTTERVYDGFLGRYDEFRAFFHGHTYTGNPLAASAALATLEIFESDGVVERQLPGLVAHFRAAVDSLCNQPHVGEIRQIGLMAGIELVRNRRSRAAFPAADRIGYRVCLEARRHGVLIRPLGDTVVLLPPLSIAREQIDRLVAAVRSSMAAVLGA